MSFLPFLVTREILAVDGGGGAAIFNSCVAIQLHRNNFSISIGYPNVAMLSTSNDQPRSQTVSRPGKLRDISDTQIDGFGQAKCGWGLLTSQESQLPRSGVVIISGIKNSDVPRGWPSIVDVKRVVLAVGEAVSNSFSTNTGLKGLVGRLLRRPWLVHRLVVYRRTRALRVSM